ncbi:MarR family transcriptional regulator [Paenibacillus spiritus]|uniref:MarR family transcriptional regulator n=1 Tax=Paenibacillus spiritus TaxID=2496557 RepID=A0A5J5FV02_9BACL|nr:MarR family transcriptional regulator [Paenibacillus spiritus]KAA8997207.1 MarR family transcriptional regulator [Paenibacillus spiritus]
MTEAETGRERILESMQALNKRISPVFERCAGITPARLKLLCLLSRTEEAGQSLIQKELGIDGAAVTRHLQALEEAGLVVRWSSKTDQRAALAALTEQGRSRMAAYRKERERFVDELLAGFGPEEQKLLLEMLERLESNLRTIQDAAYTK